MVRCCVDVLRMLLDGSPKAQTEEALGMAIFQRFISKAPFEF